MYSKPGGEREKGPLPKSLHVVRFEFSRTSGLSSRDHYAAVMTRLKSALDPNGVLAPGRYAMDGLTESDE